MKPAIALALATLAALGADPGPLPPVNPGFENGDAGWTIPSSLWRIEPGAGRGGSAALVWENDDPKAYTFPRCPFAAEPGATYRYGAWVKVDSATTKGKPVAPKVSIDFANAAGEWIGAEYARAVSAPDADGWVLFEGETAPAPAECASANLFGFVPKGGTGKVRFDDFSIAKTGRRLVDTLVSDAYRDEADAGRVTFTATLFPDRDTPRDSLAPVFVFAATDGGKAELAPDTFDDVHASVSIEVERLAPGTHPVEFVLRTRDGRDLGRASTDFTRGRALRRVAFDRHGRTLVEGRPFFPLGMYARDITPETLALYMRDDAPWNCVMPYHAPARDMLDLCLDSGLMVVYSVKDIVFGAQFAKPPFSTSREASLGEISRRALDVRDHPAILAYYTNDEAPTRQAGMLREVRSLLHDLDPDHPVWHVMDKEYKVRPLLGAYDVLGMDPYPVGLERRQPERSQMNRPSMDIRSARSATYDAVPIWQVVQAFNWAWDGRWKDESQRFPTQEEISSMTWQAIAAGANGIVYYAFHRICMGAKGEERDEYLRRVVAVANEVRDCMSLLLSDPGPAAVSAPEGAVCRTWRAASGDIALLAANATREEVVGEVSLAEDLPPQPIDLPPLGHLFITIHP